ncbi:MAG: sensor histidine kinase [Spirochaetia bacterium]|jgi:two-component system sensor histidine kinase YesM|nr:sensor histidine kinase [Spirochaetia bacterium]
MKKNNRMTKNSLSHRLKYYFEQSVIPFSLLVILLLIFLVYIGNAYNQIVLNITTANEYILTFKHDVDYALYRTVIGSANSWDTTFDKDIKDPYITISNMKQNMLKLQKMTKDKANRTRLKNIISRLDSLKGMADTINQRVKEKGHYDENMNFLELNVYILTELITSQVHEYVYYEAAHLELVRQNLMRTLLVMIVAGLLFYFTLLFRLQRINKDIAESVLKPIEDICDATGEIAKGEFINVQDEKYDYEVAVLSSSINHMSREIERLLEKTKQEQEQLRLTELQLYQSQINPHFLYNTLDTIVALVESKMPEDAVMLIERLSDFFRTSLSEGKPKILIKDEIRHVQSYLEIQQVRYQDIMQFSITVDRTLMNYLIVKLTLQPLVENALYHGIKQRRGVGHIIITGHEDDQGDILLMVRDDGIGMDKEKLQELQDSLESKVPAGKRTFGLYNVHQRLRLNYGQTYGLTLESTLGKGTTVYVKLPKEQSKDDVNEHAK